MPLDVDEVGRVLEGRVVPVQVSHPLVQVRVARADVADVAFEMLHVDGLFEVAKQNKKQVSVGILRITP